MSEAESCSFLGLHGSGVPACKEKRALRARFWGLESRSESTWDRVLTLLEPGIAWADVDDRSEMECVAGVD